LRRSSGQRVGDGVEVVAADLAQVAVACRPGQQVGPEGAQVVADRLLGTGSAARPAVVQGRGPGGHVGGDAAGELAEQLLTPGVEGGGAVVVEHAQALEDLGGAADVEAEPVDLGDLGVGDAVAGRVVRQQHQQRVVDLAEQVVGPAADLGELAGDRLGVAHKRAGRVRMAGAVKAREVMADREQAQLPGDLRVRRPGRLEPAGAPAQPWAAQRQQQGELPGADPPPRRQRAAAEGLRDQGQLQAAQPAVASS
jgi:hypothetical protein